jgi:hypothetical protein
MSEKKIFFRDPVVERVVDKFVSRSDVGYAKYGNTLHDERTKKIKGLFKYVNDVQEELMDAILYLQACKEEIQDLSEEGLLLELANLDIDEIYPEDYTEIERCASHYLQFNFDGDDIEITSENVSDSVRNEKNK